jgi:hypothetical protein
LTAAGCQIVSDTVFELIVDHVALGAGNKIALKHKRGLARYLVLTAWLGESTADIGDPQL